MKHLLFILSFTFLISCSSSNNNIYLRTGSTELNLTEQLWNYFSNAENDYSEEGYYIYFRDKLKFRLLVDESFYTWRTSEGLNKFESTLDECYLDFISDFQGALNNPPDSFTLDLKSYKFPLDCKE